MPADRRAQQREVRALAEAAGDEEQAAGRGRSAGRSRGGFTGRGGSAGAQTGNRGHGRADIGGFGIVDPLHAVDVRDHFATVFQAAVRAQRIERGRRNFHPRALRQRQRGQRVGEVVRAGRG